MQRGLRAMSTAMLVALMLAIGSAVNAQPGATEPAGVQSVARAEGDRWASAPGQAFNDGWKPLTGTATFRPCETITWYFDRSRESGDRSTMVNDVRSGVAALEPYTGLKFVEVSAPGDASLTFRWGDLSAEGYSDAAGIGGPRGLSTGAVAFDLDSYWTTNEWEGWAWREFRVARPDLGPGWGQTFRGPGRVALVIHEVMHAMGFDHVEDFTSIMYPQGGVPNNQGQLSSGDIAGLRAMYLDQPCTSASASPAEDPQAATETCISGPDVDRECWQGAQWIYSYCHATARATLQRKEGSKWLTVTQTRAKRSPDCYPDQPYLIEFTGSAKKSTTQYRFYVPRQAGARNTWVYRFTITQT